VVAEKFQAMVYLRALNSRMKDFYDVWLLARHFAFDGALLAKAIAATFANRETAIDVAPIAFTPEFTEQASTLAQWTAFRRKLPNTECPETLAEVVPLLAQFLLPIARACAAGESFDRRWPPGGPWTMKS
jgi:Nucleotidyl transferase AbiEii toxin, Type IV TA system